MADLLPVELLPLTPDDPELGPSPMKSDYRALLARHDGRLAAALPTLERNDRYYEGNIPLRYMAPALEQEFGGRITQLVLNIARWGVDAYENRLDIDGIRLDPTGDADDREQQSWSDLDMPYLSQLVHLDELAMGKSYGLAGTGMDGSPLVTAESAMQCTDIRDPATREVISGVKRWRAADGKTKMRTLYTPNQNLTFVAGPTGWELFTDNGTDSGIDDHGAGMVWLVPFVNRGRILRYDGICEFVDVIPVLEGLNKMATDMMVAGEVVTIPRRYVVGASEDDFEDENGKKISPWQQAMGKIWAIPPGDTNGPEVKVGQFPGADLTNFHNSIKLLIQIGTLLMGLPPHYASFATENPASADSIRSSEVQLVKRSERKQTANSSSWKKIWQRVMFIRDGVLSEEAKHLSVMWRDPSTPTVAQAADAAVKKVTSGIIPVEQAWIDLGYTPNQRDAMRKMRQADATRGLDAISDRFLSETAIGAPPASLPLGG